MTIAPLLARLLVAALLILAPFTGAQEARAETLLTVTASDGTVTSFDRAALNAMDRVTYDTTTIWTDGTQKFAGVPLKTLLTKAGITEGTIRAVAENDYAVEIPVADLEDTAPIVADLLNDKPFSRREKGPLWIVFPYDSDPRYRSEENFARSIWQLVRIETN